jgi:hypothetical protein
MKRIVQFMVMGCLLAAFTAAGGERNTQKERERQRERDREETTAQTTIITPETIRGEVLRVKRVKMREGRGVGVHLEIRTERGTVPVHLGPSWYVDNQRLQLKPGDQVEVTGTYVTVRDKQAMIAHEVKRGGGVLALRDERGMPAWSRGTATGRPGMGMGREMSERHEKMMEHHRKMAAEMKAMEAQLDEKVAKMNRETGEAKVDAMAEVINQLLRERKAMRENMAAMHEGMGFGGEASVEEEGEGAGAPGDDSEDVEGDDEEQMQDDDASDIEHERHHEQ